ncbi:hypothetical protein EVAR_58782_1 [Eumeta japonica]|uniref:Uncharacterized protein n=1 Tax=Eumeta variegata TaxID=151549 RepID=A0A4C1YGJ8_EUMVA|nr:hypothetical protein EVAR_58782_1 [Eumeta japonica]
MYKCATGERRWAALAVPLRRVTPPTLNAVGPRPTRARAVKVQRESVRAAAAACTPLSADPIDSFILIEYHAMYLFSTRAHLQDFLTDIGAVRAKKPFYRNTPPAGSGIALSTFSHAAVKYFDAGFHASISSRVELYYDRAEGLRNSVHRAPRPAAPRSPEAQSPRARAAPACCISEPGRSRTGYVQACKCTVSRATTARPPRAPPGRPARRPP